MRRRRSISALLITGLLVVGPGSDVLVQAAESEDESRAGSLTVEITDLTGMEGLELAGAVWGGAGQDLLYVPIDEPVFSASDRVTLGPGSYYVWIFAGEPPCDAGFIPACGPEQDVADYFCTFDLDVVPSEHILIGLSGLPVHDTEAGGDAYPCPVTAVQHSASSSTDSEGS